MRVNGVQKIGQVLVKNSPTILTGLSVAGLVTTTLMGIKATPKAFELLTEEQQKRRNTHMREGLDPDKHLDSGTLTKKDIIKLTWKCYIPTVVMGTLTITCIIGANSINLRRNAALASIYSLSEAALKEYQAKVVETIGKNKERAIKDEIAKDRITKNPVSDKELIITGAGETLCYDSLSGRYFKSDIEQIRRVLNDLSRDLLTDSHGFITLNEVYIGLGLKGTKMGEMVGWHIDDGLIDPDFSTQLTENGTPCLVLDFSVEPRYGYKD